MLLESILKKVTNEDINPDGSFAVPDHVTTISEEAFIDCTNLKHITIPYGVKKIERAAFYGCKNLIEITIPDSVTEIGTRVFACCENMTKAVLPDALTTIKESIFAKCFNLTEVHIPKNTKVIQEFAFTDCRKLANVVLPEGITSLCAYSFDSCYSLTEITIPKTVNAIYSKTFYRCEGLKKFVVDEDNPNYSADETGILFNENKTLLIRYPAANENTAYTLPNTIKRIEDFAFDGATNLKKIIFSENLEKIGAFAFYRCSALESIKFFNNLNFISISAFNGCEHLESSEDIYIPYIFSEFTKPSGFPLNKWTLECPEEKIENSGYIYFTNLFELFNYFAGNLDKGIAIYTCELGNITKICKDNKLKANTLKPVKRLFKEELIKILNNEI